MIATIDKNWSLAIIEKSITVIILMIYQGAFIELILSGGRQENEVIGDNLVDIVMRLVYFLTYIFIISMLALRWKRTLLFLSRNWLIWSLILLAVISLVWSVEQGTTIKNSFTLVCSSLFGVYLVSRYSLTEILKLLSWSFYISILSSFLLAVLFPKLGVMGAFHQGKWRGVYLHKNGLGATMTVSCIVFLVRAYGDLQKSRSIWIWFGLSFILLILSSSASALIATLALIFIFFLLRLLRLPYLILIPTIIGIILLGIGAQVWVDNNSTVLFNLVGKDSTLTGRTELWSLCWDMIWKKPWLGYGYGGFWQGLEGESAYIWRIMEFKATHAHSGYLMLLLDLGFVGFTLFWLGFMLNVFRGFVYIRSEGSSESIWLLLILVGLLITNQSESALLVSNSIDWIFYVVTSLVLDPKLQASMQDSSTRSKRISLT